MGEERSALGLHQALPTFAHLEVRIGAEGVPAGRTPAHGARLHPVCLGLPYLQPETLVISAGHAISLYWNVGLSAAPNQLTYQLQCAKSAGLSPNDS